MLLTEVFERTSMLFNRIVNLAASAALIFAVAGSIGPGWCGEAATQEQNLALLKRIEADLAKKPGDVELQVRHMQALGVARRYQDELLEAENLIARNPHLRAAFKGQMFAFVGLRDWSSAMIAIEKVKALSPLSPSELATRATILSGLGRYREALVDVNESILRNSSDAGAFFTRAECLYKLNGASDDVVRSLETTLKLDPGFPNARKLLDFMNSKLPGATAPASR